MESRRFNDESIVKALPVIAPLTNILPTSDALINGRYSEAAFGTALGVAMGVVSRILILKELANKRSIENSEVILLQGMDELIDSEDLQYEAQG